MTNSWRKQTAVVLLATVVLTAGCGGAADKLSSQRAALTSATPLPVVPSAAPTSGAAPTASAALSASSGGLPVVPSGAALSSLAATASTTQAPPASGNVSGALASANAALGGALSQVDVATYCSAIPHADIQALIKATVGTALDYPLQCGWKGTDLKVSVNPNDDDTRGASELIGSDGKAIAGVGDTAKWDSPVPNATLPDVYAQKGAKFTCFVQASDVSLSTITFTGRNPFYQISDAAELDYATKEARLCTDVFAVTP